MSFSELLHPPKVSLALDPQAAQQREALNEYYQRLWTPEILWWDVEIAGTGPLGPARFPLRKANLRWVRAWTSGAVNPGAFTVDVLYEDNGIPRSIWNAAGDYITGVAGVILFVEKAPTKPALPTFSTDYGNAKFFLYVRTYTPGPWPDLTIELVFVPA